MRVPASDELFRPTAVPDPPTEGAGGADDLSELDRRPEAPVELVARQASQGGRTSSGRVRHDEKMTVYVTSDELFEIEHARLELRRRHTLAVDRGRLVRAAIAMALADLDEHGADSALVRRLHEA